MGVMCVYAIMLSLFVQSTPGRLERLDESKLNDLVRSRDGHALFINVWATWCLPCTQEFPDIVRLSGELKGKKIDFVGVSADDFDDEIPRVLPFIVKQKAAFRFFIAKIASRLTSSIFMPSRNESASRS